MLARIYKKIFKEKILINNMLIEGEKAPQFELKDQSGKLVKLSDYKGKDVVIYFYPKDDTPGCTAEACSIRDNYNQYIKKGIVVLGISPDDERKHTKFKEKYQLPFTLLADTEKKVLKAYGVWGKKKFMGREYEGVIRTTFLIDKEQKIKEVISKVECKTHGKDLLKKY